MPELPKIVVALDGMLVKEGLSIAKKLSGLVWGFKINDLLFDSISIIKKLKKYGEVFADAKLYDIPNTVSNSVLRLSAAGADMITVHASGGIEMMRAAKKSAGKSKIIAVTVLTSHDGNVKRSVVSLVKDARLAGIDGVVCSAREVPFLPKKLLKIVPGIRPVGYMSKDDQKRTATPQEATQAGADLLVIGRPITQSKDPVHAVQQILNEIQNARITRS